MSRFGGRRVAGGGPAETLEGEENGRRIVLFEFPSLEAIRTFWGSPDYAPLKALRRDAAKLEAWAVPGA